jgi:hypothetical protein
MSDVMRVARALCALLIVVLGVPAMAVAQHGADAVSMPDPALPPAPLPPLYFPRDDRGSLPLTPELIEKANGWEQSGRRIVTVRLQRQPEDEFKPISELPPQEQLPAAPMLVAAYVFVVLALSAYVLSIARRLNAVGREIAKLESQIKRH